MIECETAAVLVTLGDSPNLRAALSSVQSQTDGLVVCVLNDASQTGVERRDGVLYVGTGMNLGWAAGVHAGLLHVRCEFVWAIQDDLLMQPGAYRELRAALRADPGLAAVRPLRVDEQGCIGVGHLGWQVDRDGIFYDPRPSTRTSVEHLGHQPPGAFMASSGQLIRRTAWDQVGGFDPWFYPWGYIDVDFGRSLSQSGWRFEHVPTASMRHGVSGSSTRPFRKLITERNRSLFVAKWAQAKSGLLENRCSVAPTILAASQEGACKPRPTSLGILRRIAGIAAADVTVFLAQSMEQLTKPLETQVNELLLRVENLEASLRQGAIDPLTRGRLHE